MSVHQNEARTHSHPNRLRSLSSPYRCHHAAACVCLQGQYYEAECIDIDPVKRTATCQYVKPFRGGDVEGRQFSVPYDVLIVAVSTLLLLTSLHSLLGPVCVSSIVRSQQWVLP